MYISTFITVFAGLSIAQTINFTAVKKFPPPSAASFAVGVSSQRVDYDPTSAAVKAFAAVKSAALGHAGALAIDLARREPLTGPHFTDPLEPAPLPTDPPTTTDKHHHEHKHTSESLPSPWSRTSFNMPIDPMPLPTQPPFEPSLHSPHSTHGPIPLVARSATASASLSATTSVASACRPEASGAGPVPTPDTPAAWLADPHWAKVANNAGTPDNYVQSYVNLNASNIAYGYLGYQYINSYAPNRCANLCNKLAGCTSFNIYFERDPCLTPGPSCMNPESTTTIKCAFWGGYIDATSAVNYGQFRQSFQVLIGGSNGYNRYDGCTEAPLPGYSQPEYLGNATILAQPDCNGVDSYLGFDFFNQGPFDYNLCAASCNALSAVNLAVNLQTCQFFTTYLLYENGNVLRQYCAMYSEYWSDQYATNVGQWDDNGNHWTISNAYSSYNLTNPGYANPRCSWQGVPTVNTVCISSTSSRIVAPSTASPSLTSTVKPSTTSTISTSKSVVSSSIKASLPSPTTASPTTTATTRSSTSSFITTATSSSRTSSSGKPTTTTTKNLPPPPPPYGVAAAATDAVKRWAAALHI